MATVLQDSSDIQRLRALEDDDNRFDISAAELLPMQLAAADALLRDRVEKIRLLKHRAEEGGVAGIRAAEDIVPVLFAHSTYKSYPESWLTQGKWDRLGQWLDTVSTNRVEHIDVTDVQNVDDWLGRLEQAGHFVSCSSGTSGKAAMLNASGADLDWAGRDAVSAFAWGSGVAPRQDRKMFGLAPTASAPRNLAIKAALFSAFGEPGEEGFTYPMAPITIGQVVGMVALRRSMADGTAKPGDIAAFEATSSARQKAVDDAVIISARALIESRAEKLYLSGMWASLYKIAETVRSMGYGRQDFQAENTIYIGGGLKGAVLPENYREFVFETFNIAPERVFQMYGMQELGSAMPRCHAGRYHVPPWVMLILLDQGGDNVVAQSRGEAEGRAAFFDMSLEGRWNGVISGDKIVADFGTCPCGRRSPSIHESITRYADLPGGDKITCAGTIDAYVRGVA